MKNMLYVFIALIFTAIGFGIGFFCSESAESKQHTKEIKAHEAEQHRLVLEIEKQGEKIDGLRQANKGLSDELSRKADEVETLNDIIVRMRTAPEATKLLKERIPYGMTNTICFMDYRKITDTASWQYKLQQECETTVLSGIRIYTDASGNEYLCTALGSAYGRDIGDTWHVTLDCGTEFDIIYAEYKDDGTTDFFGHPDDNYDGQDCINILEFVVDVNQMPAEALDKGTFTALSYFGGLSGNGGNVAKMEYTGRVWEP